MKYYAVKVGKAPGIYTTWAECQENTKGVKGAIFKSFSSLTEAENYMANGATYNTVTGEDEFRPEDHTDMVVAYTDGSSDFSRGLLGYGVCFLYPNGKQVQFSGQSNDPSLISMNNVGAELLGAIAILSYVKETGIKELIVCYDYEGIRAWCQKDWGANTHYSQQYARLYDEISSYVKIHFVHTYGHNGIKYNEICDGLARRAIGLPQRSAGIESMFKEPKTLFEAIQEEKDKLGERI